MTAIQKKLLDAYVVVVMGKLYITKEEDRVSPTQILVPDISLVFKDGTESTMREQVEIQIALKEIELLEKLITD